MTDPGIGPRLTEIGQIIADIFHDHDPEGAYMYTEVGDRWQEVSVLTYVIEGERFDADYKYPDQIDEKVSGFERREQALLVRYGDESEIAPVKFGCACNCSTRPRHCQSTSCAPNLPV